MGEKINENLISKMSKSGYLGSVLPEQYGGMNLDMVTAGILNEEVGRGCSSARSLLTVHGMVELAILRWGNNEQRQKWLPILAKGTKLAAFALTEPNVGSDAKSIESTAILENNYYVINGTKKWTTLGQIADLFLVFAKVNDKPTAFLVDRNTQGLHIKPINGLMGARASMVAELSFEDCKVPIENAIGSIGMGLTHVAMTCLDYGRYTIAFGCVGAAQCCLEESIKYSKKRKQFGQPIRKNQLIQKMISEMVVNIKAARLLCYNAGCLKDNKEHDSIMETWNAKYFASTVLQKVASDAVQIHGAIGCCNGTTVERCYRDAKINEIIEGTTQMHEVLISTSAMRGF
ncbi:acyl-CoA dehydrogenase family protein [Paraclostridium ghonii]|uniref:Alkylation response protein AidB-like acyl-CoA dehydrogenase n=1 Tax=Paraclostridium ghonii TaxID=29358 RepID=A0ABU0N1C9_9FIRM|nr:alkylation response protein AidB-like acyl-CoA dehydrogenase [Paeniclostridium ghonii]